MLLKGYVWKHGLHMQMFFFTNLFFLQYSPPLRHMANPREVMFSLKGTTINNVRYSAVAVMLTEKSAY